MTKRQKKAERIAAFCETITKRLTGKRSQVAMEIRAKNRRIDKKKGQTR